MRFKPRFSAVLQYFIDVASAVPYVCVCVCVCVLIQRQWNYDIMALYKSVC